MVFPSICVFSSFHRHRIVFSGPIFHPPGSTYSYFILSDAIVNEIVLMSEFVTDYCILIFYLATLLNLSNSFLVRSSGFSIHNIMSSANKPCYLFLPNLED